MKKMQTSIPFMGVNINLIALGLIILVIVILIVRGLNRRKKLQQELNAVKKEEE